jgi:hypothetical protein
MIPTTRLPACLALLGLVLAANGAFGVTWLFDGAERFSQTAASWQFATFQRVQLPALVLLVLLVPTFAQLRGRTGRALPTGVLLGLVVAVVLQAGTVFTMAFVAPFLAGVAPEALDLENGGTFAVAMSGVWVLFVVAMAVFGVSAVRRKILPATAGGLVVLGGLLTPMFGPLAGIVLGTGLVVAARALRGRVGVALPEAVPALQL